MSQSENKAEKLQQAGNRDHPEQYPTDKPSLFDLFESEQNVDPIPMEDLNMEQQEENRHEETKHQSSSENKYK
ncbi:hypothetical protein OIN60_11585 [Paenibacillus sp. P96]|uniref:YfhD family protein n=1 Tax=Paenibacillus zeirhizosphaerae TaxID=2987519 RepID=A0ABT9FRQ5_9BACL|nr:hypothetical protein [Paenibacillus sp. P96]MDP4097411.1 hypothetical protein [Paenibacillus sp. P96]